MKENYLKIIFVIDESGSMQGTESDVVGGFNNFIDQQRSQPHGKITVSLYKFNSHWSRVVNDLQLNEIRPLTNNDYTPGGLTALYDTIGNAINDIVKQTAYSESECNADTVIMVIITDGQENASSEYDSRKVKQMIQELEKSENWQFIYLGTDLNNFSDADTLGLKYQASSNKTNLKQKFNVVSEHSLRFRIADPEENKDRMMEAFIDDLEKDEDRDKR
ncbi:vWA domain-containing protein [Proteiniphilum propionicum]|uniref:vWA domain-containing protein n=1 Tax=Proteiniphilum propionicum TaxID=2829812 RepID=UPI001EEC8CDB|nr:vWA domain-containing protein [Proteiniphilum propionicum]ULB35210.1 VWA domain-containing protein [Proteiniphilum propionicum]